MMQANHFPPDSGSLCVFTEGGDEEQRSQLSSSLQSGGESTTGQDAAVAITVRAVAIPKETASPSFMGKHRMVAAVAQLHQQIQIIQEELEELETLGESSIVCRELVSAVESIPDALLPVTKGPAVVGWDRWFQGAHGSRGRKRWI